LLARLAAGALLALPTACGDATPDGNESQVFEAGAAPVANADSSVGAVDAGPRPPAQLDAGALSPGLDSGSARAQDSATPSDSGVQQDASRDASEPSSTDASVRDGGVRDGGGSDGGVSSEAGTSIHGKFVGNITTENQVRADFADYWNQITPENEGKWGSVEAKRNDMKWDGLDRVHDYARQHGLVFKQHTLVWGSQQPTWLNGLSAAEQKAEVEQWIRLFCERYPDVALIDVVNEPPPHTTPVYLDAIGGAGASKYDWIVQAFKWAHQYCPNAKLILNDYNNIEYGDDNTRIITIANAIKAAGAPIDAVGAQAHDAYKLPTATVQQMIDKLASSTGLPVYITEYDIGLADDGEQQRVMQSQMTMFWNNQHVQGITLWGYVVGATWRPNTGLMSASGNKRPAMTWLLDFLKNAR
jgi:endo-1,4-beta-xylanase